MHQNNVWLLLDTSGLGGIESHVTLLARSLRSQGLGAEIVLIGDHGPHPLARTWRDDGIPVRVLSGGVPGLFRALEASRPTLVHTHGYKAGILGRIACQLRKIPVVSTYHAGEPGIGRVRLYNRLDAQIGLAAQKIAVSKKIANRLPGDVHVIPNFIDVPPTVSCKGESVAFVGRLSHEKGPDRFLKIAEDLSDVLFDVFGDGPLRADLERQAPSNVRLRGNVPSMANYWTSISLLCISSRHEGLPMVALEAMAHGVPVAAFGVGALPQLITHGDDGFIAEPGNAAALTGAVATWNAFSPREKARMSFHAHRRVANDYSVRAILPRILSVYESAIAASNTEIGTTALPVVNA